jgi:hypothetical protein
MSSFNFYSNIKMLGRDNCNPKLPDPSNNLMLEIIFYNLTDRNLGINFRPVKKMKTLIQFILGVLF